MEQDKSFSVPPAPVDLFALIRTELANERTLLAWLRTSLALAAAGAGLLRLGGPSDRPYAIAAFLAAVFVAVAGVGRFAHARALIARVPTRRTGPE